MSSPHKRPGRVPLSTKQAEVPHDSQSIKVHGRTCLRKGNNYPQVNTTLILPDKSKSKAQSLCFQVTMSKNKAQEYRNIKIFSTPQCKINNFWHLIKDDQACKAAEKQNYNEEESGLIKTNPELTHILELACMDVESCYNFIC